jgi:hypothetical protein
MMRCAICGSQITAGREQVVLTTDGLYVHIRCADHEARREWAARQLYALLYGGLIIAGALALLLISGWAEGAVIVLLLGMVIHGVVHRRWWLHLLLPMWFSWRKYWLRR